CSMQREHTFASAIWSHYAANEWFAFLCFRYAKPVGFVTAV
ncbi:hypothetical protein E3A20_24170, partial [Planctomyces bekefii]